MSKWWCISGQTFCCICTIRSGASVVGWFNFIVNSIYIGMMVFALARVTEDVNKRMIEYNKANAYLEELGWLPTDKLEFSSGDGNSASSEDVMPGQGSVTSISLTQTQKCNADPHNFTIDACMCQLLTIRPNHSDCHTVNYCICELEYILKYPVPTLYRSTAIPGIMLVFSILWLTTVEARAILWVRRVGYSFMFCIVVQLILQLWFLVYVNRELIHFKTYIHSDGLKPIHWIVWLTYAFYAVINIYFLPTLHKYIKLRTKEYKQGLEQGLLTTEIFPPQGRDLDVYLEDAFAIDGEPDNDRFHFSIDDVTPTNYGTSTPENDEIEKVEYEYKQAIRGESDSS